METWYLAITSPITRKPGKCRVDDAAVTVRGTWVRAKQRTGSKT